MKDFISRTVDICKQLEKNRQLLMYAIRAFLVFVRCIEPATVILLESLAGSTM